MTIAAISAISFVLGATVAYVASRYPGHREVIDAVGAVFLIGWALLSSLVINAVSADAVDANATAPEPQV
ncbi:MAG TPA: hypothetical protein VNU65_14050 [Xanthobacteraceae bacterium]|jgi:hypothetical protein|nr:hypothetical protein [Xanthobacteraceae bacterium]